MLGSFLSGLSSIHDKDRVAENPAAFFTFIVEVCLNPVDAGLGGNVRIMRGIIVLKNDFPVFQNAHVGGAR